MTHYFIAPDSEGEPTFWKLEAPMSFPQAVMRRCDNEEVWELLIRGKFSESELSA